MEFLSFFALYIAPGLFCGFMWKKWGFALGAGVTIAARLLSVFNLGMIGPFFAVAYGRYSFAHGVQELPNFFVILLGSGAMGVVCGFAGQMVSRMAVSKVSWSRWLSRSGMLLVTLGFVLAGGAWVFGLMPWGGPERPKSIRGLLERFGGICDTMDGPVLIVLWAGIVLTALCVLVSIPEATKLLGSLGGKASALRKGGARRRG